MQRYDTPTERNRGVVLPETNINPAYKRTRLKIASSLRDTLHGRCVSMQHERILWKVPIFVCLKSPRLRLFAVVSTCYVLSRDNLSSFRFEMSHEFAA